MNIQIADWGVEISFVSTAIGKELSVAADLLGQPAVESCHYYRTYGYFDLAAVRIIERLDTPYLVLLHRHITESAPFRFFAEGGGSREHFEQILDKWNAAIAVVVKIQAWSDPPNGDERGIVAERIRECFQDAFVFFGLGFSELLLMCGGDNIAELLTRVLHLRGLTAPTSSTPLLSKTTTFPFISYSLLKDEKYEGLIGEVEPVISVSCLPSAERVIAGDVNAKGIIAKNVYGKNDLLLAWPRRISVAELTRFVSELREKWGDRGAIRKTTTYLETAIDADSGSTIPPAGQSVEFLSTSEENELFAKLRCVEPHSLRGGLSDLILRLTTCLRDPQLAPYYQDMVNTVEYVQNILDAVASADRLAAKEAQAAAARVATIARAAINQRYAALELHPETLAHSHSPLLCDIRTLVAAATCLPHFIFDNLIPNKRAIETWAGFVLFGGAYSPQWYDQHVLALPPASLLRPITEWWKLTHEAAHGIYYILSVSERLDPVIFDYIKSADVNSDLSANHIIGEQFANWFDWRYVFRRDTSLYLRLVWSSWIEIPLVWQSKSQYLARSFAVLICEDLSSLAAAAAQPREVGVMPLLKTRWARFEQATKSVERMDEFLKALSPEERDDVFEMVCNLLSLLRWFESRFERACGVAGLEQRLSPTYETVEHHVTQLRQGRVVLEGIKDPIRLHLNLIGDSSLGSPTLATEVAYIYSLQNCYAQQQR
jgi:hypothetical protein